MVQRFILKILIMFIKVFYKIYWSPKQPWCIARLNISWKKYTESLLYKLRMEELGKEWCESLFTNVDVKFFLRNISIKEKLQIIFLPFSCGDKFKLIPLWRKQNE